MTATNPTPFQKWYEKNKATIAAKRAERYRTDPDYRAAIQARLVAQRTLRDQSRAAQGVSLTQACQILDVSVWTMNRWKNEKYIPLDTLRSHRFTDHQLKLLGLLKQFFVEHPKRSVALHRDKQDALVATIHHNWKGD